MAYLTFNQWARRGYVVAYGERSRYRTPYGTPTFGSHQVTRPAPPPRREVTSRYDSYGQLRSRTYYY